MPFTYCAGGLHDSARSSGMGGIPRRRAVSFDCSAMNRDHMYVTAFLTGLLLLAVLFLPVVAHAVEAGTDAHFPGRPVYSGPTAGQLCVNGHDGYGSWNLGGCYADSGSGWADSGVGGCPVIARGGGQFDYMSSMLRVADFVARGCSEPVFPPDVCAETAGTVVSSGMIDLGTDENATPPVSACDGTCELSYNGSGVVARQLVGGVFHYFSEGSYIRIASSCTVADVPSSSTALPPPTCDPQTQDQGTINGKFVCLDRQTTKTTTESPLVTNPDGSTTKTSTTSDSATGQDTTTVTTTAPDGTVTQSTTTQPTPGSPGDSTDFCKEHPTDPTCTKDDIPWGDIPEAGIIPTHEVPVSTAYTVIGGEGQCPAPGSVSFMGQALEWSYQPICTFAEAIRPLVIGLAWLSFGFIIVGGLSRGK